MDEFALIERFFASHPMDRFDVRLGIGDDAAVTRIEAGYDLVIATDSICQGTHFPEGTEPRALGHRCLAVNLSDLAAMGAEPAWCTLVLSLPSAEPEWVREFARGFFDLADHFDVALVGGDTIRGPLAMTVTVHGRVGAGAYVTRTGAEPGQAIYVTGYPGEAAAGLRLIRDNPGDRSDSAEHLKTRFLYPDARVSEGLTIRTLTTAMIDLSDGLHADLTRMLEASQVGAEVEVDCVPLSAALRSCFDAQESLEFALIGGDDYELCFTVPFEREAELVRSIDSRVCPVTRIGQTTARNEILWSHRGRPFAVPKSSFRHF